ncbi:MAG: hypothetical protein RJR37_02540 [Peptococcaceae bacterium MAG4]|nr:hypothetical protein [Peptococcaceae bacterium MAG4]
MYELVRQMGNLSQLSTNFNQKQNLPVITIEPKILEKQRKKLQKTRSAKQYSNTPDQKLSPGSLEVVSFRLILIHHSHLLVFTGPVTGL